MATRDGRAQIWYADGSGNVTGYTESVDDIAGTIIDAYNEHFGTDISIWTPETKTLQVGDTIPDWNAYEKIELLDDKIKLKMADNMWSFASIRNNTVYVAASGEYTFFVVDNNGNISQSLSGIESLIQRNWLPKLSDAGFNYEVSQEIVDYQIGQSLESWSRYISI